MKEEKEKAIALRKQGKSLNEIVRELHSEKHIVEKHASRSSVSRWVKDVPIADEFLLKLQAKNPIGGRIYADRCRDNRKTQQDIGRNKLKNSENDYAFACGLFWAEGSKKRNTVEFTNIDSLMIKFFLDFLRKYFNVKNEDVSIRLNVYLDNGLSLEDIEKYWCSFLNLEKTCLRKATIKSVYYPSSRKTKHNYGVCTLRVNDTNMCQQIFGSVKEMVNDNSDRWLS